MCLHGQLLAVLLPWPFAVACALPSFVADQARLCRCVQTRPCASFPACHSLPQPEVGPLPLLIFFLDSVSSHQGQHIHTQCSGSMDNAVGSRCKDQACVSTT